MRTEVLVIVSHLIISLAVLVAYGFTLYKGSPDVTLQNLLLIIGGYWFGAMGIGLKNKGNDQTPPKDGSQ